MGAQEIKGIVREKYAAAARRVKSGEHSCGCGTSDTLDVCDPITSNLYSASQVEQVPGEALEASLGCGNPTVLAELKPGETVLDLGSGGGIDVLLSARRVGPEGKAYGLDITDEMLQIARENQRRAGIENAEFLKGEMERIPLPADSIDVILSNCVVNLSPAKDRVFAEAYRVLKPGGRLGISDVVIQGKMPPAVRRSVELWAGCVAGALEQREYRDKLKAAGFEAVEIEPTRIFRQEEAKQFLSAKGIDVDAIAPQVAGKVMSAFIRGRKPARS